MASLMGEKRVVLSDFPGMIDNEDPQDIPAGAASTQINLDSRVIGRLQVRRGFRRLNFDSTPLVGLLTDA